MLSIELGVSPVGGLIAVGQDVYVPAGRGVFQPLDLQRAGEANP